MLVGCGWASNGIGRCEAKCPRKPSMCSHRVSRTQDGAGVAAAAEPNCLTTAP